MRCPLAIGLLTMAILALAPKDVRAQAAVHQPDEMEALVANLYREVVARHPLGIPYGADALAFDPYLSKRLLHRFELADACFGDYMRENPDPNMKPPGIGLFEKGIFSGGSERSAPESFAVVRSERERDGSSRVYVRLTWEDPQYGSGTWQVAVVLIREKGKLVVDDALYLKDENDEVDWSLSKGIAPGCVGGRWVGNRRHRR